MNLIKISLSDSNKCETVVLIRSMDSIVRENTPTLCPQPSASNVELTSNVELRTINKHSQCILLQSRKLYKMHLGRMFLAI